MLKMIDHAYEQAREREEKAQQVFERKTVAFELDGKKFSIAKARKLFEAVQNPAGWKEPVRASVEIPLVVATIRAIEFFQGCKPDVAGLDRDNRGCLIVVSEGYVG